MRYKVVLIDYDDDLFAPRGWEGEALARCDAEWIAAQCRKEATVVEVARDADVVMIQSVRPLLGAKVIRQLNRCRCIVRVGIGYENVDVATATALGILVCNVPAYCVDDVADHALALLLATIRHIARQDRWIRAQRWDRTGVRPAHRIRGRTLGFIAFGRIARALAHRVSGFDLTLLAYDPYVDADTMACHGVHKVELDELLRRSDFISVHVPLMETTRRLLGPRQFALMKPGAILVNTSRGPVLDEAALIEALRSGKLAGAGLDVMEQEPLPADSPLRTLDNVTLTPHVGAFSEESVGDLYRAACQIACEVLGGRWPASVVNPEVEPRIPLVRPS